MDFYLRDLFRCGDMDVTAVIGVIGALMNCTPGAISSVTCGGRAP